MMKFVFYVRVFSLPTRVGEKEELGSMLTNDMWAIPTALTHRVPIFITMNARKKRNIMERRLS